MSSGSIGVRVRGDGRDADVRLGVSDVSPWCALLGEWALPDERALDRLAGVIDSFGGEVEELEVAGCPSAALLVIVWARTIWDRGELVVRIRWDRVEDPAGQGGRQAAGKLACLLADKVVCADEEVALRLWGVEAGELVEGDVLEMYDQLANLIDLWGGGVHYDSPAAGWAEAARKAIVACSSMGQRRIALYGAGTHTRALGEVLMEPDVEIVGIIDDDARRHGDRMWGYPIVSPERAMEMKPDAVVLSANSIEDRLWEKTAVFREAGIEVVRLYSGKGG